MEHCLSWGKLSYVQAKHHIESTWTLKQGLKGQQSVWVLMLCSQEGMGHSLVSIVSLVQDLQLEHL